MYEVYASVQASMGKKTIVDTVVGISCFVSSLPGFSGVLKQRYSDFIVNEVDRDGKVVRLTSFDLPAQCNDMKEEEKQLPSDRDYSSELETFRLLCGDSDTEVLQNLLNKVISRTESDIAPIVLSPDSDKCHRADVHEFFKRNFKFLVTDTVEGSDGIQKSIRIRLGSDPRSGNRRGKKRKDANCSDLKDNRPFDSRGSASWPEHFGKFIRFHLYKENKDTQEALGVIGKMLGIQPRSFGFAGTKDKRAVTTQQVTVFKLHPNRLAALNSRLIGIKVGDFCFVKEGLVLGQLGGNRFTITLRSVIGESEAVIKAAVDSLTKNGFINYYGLQRFGSGSVPTHVIGSALLRGEWKDAVNLILDPREGERDDIREAREYYKEHRDIDVTLRKFPRHLVAERAILQCLKKNPGNYLQSLKAIPRTLRMMYVHSYQSFLWNHAVSARVKKCGTKEVVLGDLVYCKENPAEEATVTDACEANDDVDNMATDSSYETIPEEKIHTVKVVDPEDIARGIYSFEDVVLPLPGSQTIFPVNEIADMYHEMATKDGISLTEAAHGVKEFSITSMKGGYRRLFQRLVDCEWDLMTYTDENKSLTETDMDIMRKTKPDAFVETLYGQEPAGADSAAFSQDPPKLALKLSFTLPASSYATMAIRELLKASV